LKALEKTVNARKNAKEVFQEAVQAGRCGQILSEERREGEKGSQKEGRQDPGQARTHGAGHGSRNAFEERPRKAKKTARRATNRR